jgi:hypothetical protein
MIVSSEISHNKKNMPWLFLSSSEVLLCLHYKLASMVSFQELKYLYYDLNLVGQTVQCMQINIIFQRVVFYYSLEYCIC